MRSLLEYLSNHYTPIETVVQQVGSLWGVDIKKTSENCAEFNGTEADLQKTVGRRSLKDFIEHFGFRTKCVDSKILIYAPDVQECCAGDAVISTTPCEEPDMTGLGQVKGGKKKSARSQMKHLKNFLKESEGGVNWQCMLDEVPFKTHDGRDVTDRELIYSAEQMKGKVDGEWYWWNSSGKCIKKESGTISSDDYLRVNY